MSSSDPLDLGGITGDDLGAGAHPPSERHLPVATPRRVVVQIAPTPAGVPSLPYVDGIETFLVQYGLAVEWAGIAQDFPGVTLEREFFSLTVAQLQTLMNRAERQLGQRTPDLMSYFHADTPDGFDVNELRDRLAAMSVVTRAYIEPGRTPPPVVSVIPQPYLGARDVGIGATNLQSNPAYQGTRGEGTTFADVEQGWYVFDDPGDSPDLGPYVFHQDLIPNPPTASPGVVTLPPWGGVSRFFPDHGTSVVGVIRALDNAGGETGIAPAARGYCVSLFRSPTADQPARANAVSVAAWNLNVGDVLLIEDQVPVTGAGDPTRQLWPVEALPAVQDAIIVASAGGIVVVEATGNGPDVVRDQNGNVTAQGQGDLDQMLPSLTRGNPGFRDSGAVLAAAASSTAPHARLSDTRYGGRVDCYAWGEKVATLGMPLFPPNPPTPATDLEPSFGGSSAASAIIAGAALVVQGIHRAHYGFPASSPRVRELLRDRTPGQNIDSANGFAVDRIGVMPDLEKIAAVIVPQSAPDIYLRDNVTDDGTPHSGPSSNSPDIIVRRNPVGDPNASYGEGSGTEGNDDLSESVLVNQDHSLYVRLRNRNLVDSGPVNVDLYWSPPSTLVTPSMWRKIGSDSSQPSVVVPAVRAGDFLTVSDAITWKATDIPPAGHFCFVAVADTAGDPAPHPMWLATWDNFVRYIVNNNNVTWRNFDVVDGLMSGQPIQVPFEVRGAEDRDVRMWFELGGKVSPGFKIQIIASSALRKLLMPFSFFHLVPEFIRTDRPIALNLGGRVFSAGSRHKCGLQITALNPSAWPFRGRLWLRQMALHGGTRVEVGRMTWKFRP